MTPRFTVEERAARYQRRHTGPWETKTHELWPVAFTHRFRRRQRIEFVELNVAVHDLCVHAIARGELLRLAKWLSRRLQPPLLRD